MPPGAICEGAILGVLFPIAMSDGKTPIVCNYFARHVAGPQRGLEVVNWCDGSARGAKARPYILSIRRTSPPTLGVELGCVM